MEPTTGLEAKFSLSHNVALGLLNKADGALSLYQDETFEMEDVAALRKLAAVEGKPEFDSFYSEVVVHQKDGKVIKQEFDISRPMRDLDEQEAKLAKKFRALAKPLVGDGEAEELVAAIAGLEAQTNMSEWAVRTRIGS